MRLPVQMADKQRQYLPVRVRTQTGPTNVTETQWQPLVKSEDGVVMWCEHLAEALIMRH